MNTIHILLLSVLLPLALVSQYKVEQPQNPGTEVIDKFHVIGILARTTNENQQAATDIEALWTKFWGEEIAKQVPNTVNTDIYALYTDYETDYTGAYTVILGLPVSSLDDIPQGFVGITVEKDAYQKFVSKGKMPEAVIDTWREIWSNETLNRAYHIDFTVHGKKYYDGDKAEVETFISVE